MDLAQPFARCGTAINPINPLQTPSCLAAGSAATGSGSTNPANSIEFCKFSFPDDSSRFRLKATGFILLGTPTIASRSLIDAAHNAGGHSLYSPSSLPSRDLPV